MTNSTYPLVPASGCRTHWETMYCSLGAPETPPSCFFSASLSQRLVVHDVRVQRGLLEGRRSNERQRARTTAGLDVTSKGWTDAEAARTNYAGIYNRCRQPGRRASRREKTVPSGQIALRHNNSMACPVPVFRARLCAATKRIWLIGRQRLNQIRTVFLRIPNQQR
jgi:hypothetical protein